VSRILKQTQIRSGSRRVFTRAISASISKLFPALLAFLISSASLKAIGFNDGFETYVAGALDSTLIGGPNSDGSGGANPWFGSAPPNLRVVSAENGVTPHGGTNMIRGCYNCLYDNDVDWFNLSYRCATGGVYTGNVALEWWFYDPLGSLGGGDYVDYVAIGNYSPVPPDTDYDAITWPTVTSQRMSLGSFALRFNTNIDATKYQARIVGATDGVNASGWFNLTNSTRTVGWHHARIVIGVPNGSNTLASFYIDDMVSPALSHTTVNTNGFNLLEVNGDVGNTSGYFDDLAFSDNVTAPSFVTGPTNVTILAGGGASFSVAGASGTPAPSYYWQKDGVVLTNGGRFGGVTTSTLTITGALAADAGSYSCLVSNLAGVAVASATLTVVVPPTIDGQTPPGGTFSVGVGGTANLSVTAHATHAINYQWNKGGNPLSNGGHVSGVTTATLTLTGVDATDVGSYVCHLSNTDGTADSAAVTLSLASGPTIGAQPTNQVVALGGTANFTVSASGAGLQYLWSKAGVPMSNGGRVSGATTATLTISSVIDPDNGTSYSCLITNAGGQTNSAAATLTVIDPPAILTQPVSQTASNNVTVSFHVVASGTVPTYRWKKGGVALNNGGDFSGVTTADLSVHVTSSADLGIYSVTVSNLAGNVTSQGAALRLNQAVTNFFDDFEAYSTSDPVSNRGGTPLDYNYGDNAAAIDPWWGPSPPNFCTYVSGQEGVTPHSGNNMVGAAYAFVAGSGDNDETFLNLAYRFNSGQIYYGNILLDWYFYDPGTPDYGDQLTLANFGARVPTTSDSSGFQIPATPIQNLFLGAWPNLDTNKYQAGIMGATDGTTGIISKNISGSTRYFNTTASRSLGWHEARIVVGPADPATHLANVKFFVDDMSNPAFVHDLQGTNVGFNALHFIGATIFSPKTSETGGFFDDVSFQAANDPFIVQQPISLTNNFGTTATFNVIAMASGYQWLKNSNPISGATNSTLTLNSVSVLDAASYSCVVSGANGSITSSSATLTVVGSPPVLSAALIGQKVVITWSGPYTLLSATNVTGPYVVVPSATSPYTNNVPLDARRFFGLGQ
jgi:hypothetical protein